MCQSDQNVSRFLGNTTLSSFFLVIRLQHMLSKFENFIVNSFDMTSMVLMCAYVLSRQYCDELVGLFKLKQ